MLFSLPHKYFNMHCIRLEIRVKSFTTKHVYAVSRHNFNSSLMVDFCLGVMSIREQFSMTFYSNGNMKCHRCI